LEKEGKLNDQGTTNFNVIETLKDPAEIQNLGFKLIRSAREEVLGILSTANAFHRLERAGLFSVLKENSSNFNTKIKILTPIDDKINEIEKVWEDEIRVEIRPLEEASQISVSILIVDGIFSLVVELKDDTKYTSIEAIGLATYSNSPPTVRSYVSIFETLWQQSELCNKLKIHDKLQNEFINVAAHELRTPIQPIISLIEPLRSHVTSVVGREILDVVVRNAERLKRLALDILDVTRIESRSFQLNVETFNLNELLVYLIVGFKEEIKNNKTNINLTYRSHSNSIIIEGDKGRIAQVICNLMNNAMKVSKNGDIFVNADVKDQIASVSLRDTGTGIHSEIMPRLFSKFVTMSNQGTGLGLFISKSIVEAHGGTIMGKNNAEGKGATFRFTLPVVKNKEEVN
jgi:two-component system sensor histidine kinase VicK